MTIDTMTLLAYLDGQLEHEADYERVEQALHQEAGLRERLQALVQQSATIRSAFRAKLEEPVPLGPPSSAPTQCCHRRRHGPGCAAASLSLIHI